MTEPTSIPARPPNGRNRWFVYTGMAMTFILFLVFVALLYHTWRSTPEPTAVIEIIGKDPVLEGVIVEVNGLNLNEPIQYPLTAENKYSGKIYLVPGHYDIIFRKEDQILRQHQFGLERLRQLQFSMESLAAQIKRESNQ